MMGTLLTLGLYSHQSKTQWSIAYFFISLNTTLMLIMFPSFSHDGTKEFGSAVKKSLRAEKMQTWSILIFSI